MTATARGDLVLESGGARIVVSPLDGGRLASVTVGGLELLSGGPADGPMGWGSYPMVPWAGRIRHGRFAFGGREHRLPLGLPPHAIHGVVYDRPWTIVDAATIAIDLDERWPYRGRVTQRFTVEPGGLEVALTVEAGEPMPATVGWHPWFRRTLVPGDPRVELRFDAATMLVRDAEGMPSGERVAPTPGPWDDAFTDLRADPVLTWPGRLQVELASSCPWWVVYSMPEHAICVEPQSGPPDAVNLELAELAEPGRPLVHAMRWRWTRL